MRQRIFVRLMTCSILFVLLLACELFSATPTPDAIATGVAGTKTVWARATSVANTLIAEGAMVTFAPTPVSLTPTVSTPRVTLAPTAALPTAAPPSTQVTWLKKGNWKGQGGPESTEQSVFDDEHCWRNNSVSERICPEFSIFFTVQEGNSITVKSQGIRFSPQCSVMGGTLTRNGVIISLEFPNVLVEKNEFRLGSETWEVLGRVVAPDRVEGTYHFKATINPIVSCGEVGGIWTASSE